MTKSRNILPPRTRWTDEQLALLRELYPHEPTAFVAGRIGRSIRSTYEKALAIGLRKTPEFLRSGRAGRLDGIKGMPTRFKPGQQPWNAGLKGWQAGGRSAETQFKKGMKPQTWHPIGHERITDDGYLQRKMNDTGVTRRDYVNVHWLVWFEAGREIPPGHILVFRDGNRQNIVLENLELITRQENMRRNTVHNLPKPLAELVQLRGALQRKINRLTNTNAKDHENHAHSE